MKTISTKDLNAVKRYYIKTGQKIPKCVLNPTKKNRGSFAFCQKKMKGEIRSGKSSLREKYSKIASFLDIKIDFKRVTKKKREIIESAYAELSPLIHTGSKVYRPRKKENLKVAKEALHINNTHIKAIPFRAASKSDKVVTKNGAFFIESEVFISTRYLFDMENMVIDRFSEFEKARKFFEEQDIKWVRILAGQGEFLGGQRLLVDDAISTLAMSINNYLATDLNSYYARWAYGFEGIIYKTSNSKLQREAEIERKKRRNKGLESLKKSVSRR